MWGIAWGIKIKTSVFEAEKSFYNTDIINYINGSGERIRTSDLRVMSPMSYLTAPPRDHGRKIWSGKPDSNRRPSAWKADALAN